jgi:hypothetical protein
MTADENVHVHLEDAPLWSRVRDLLALRAGIR